MKVDIFASDTANEIVQVQGGQATELSLTYRPYMYDFLEDMSRLYELVIYSSLSRDYLQAILDRVEKKKKYFSQRFNDEFCIFANIAYSVRCLDFLYANRSAADIILVDNTVTTFPLSPNNFLPISPFDGSSTDQELPKLAAVLTQLQEAADIPTAIQHLRTSNP